MTVNGLNDKSVVKGVELRADTLILGLQASPPNVPQLVVDGVSYTIADFIKKVQDLEQPFKDARAAHGVLRQFTLDKSTVGKTLVTFLANAKIGLASVLGRDSDKLTAYGFKPFKAAKPLTSEQKTLRAAKARLTRAARHTMGKKQKAALKATDTPVVNITIEPKPDQTVAPQGGQTVAPKPDQAAGNVPGKSSS